MFRKFFVALGVLLFSILPGIKYWSNQVRHFLDWIGYSTAPEDAGNLLDKLDQAPWWAVFGLMFASWVIAVLALTFKQQTRDSTGAAQTNTDTPNSPQTPVYPDWTINELFQHVGGDELLNDKNWVNVGNDIRDKFSTSQLKVWGREVDETGMESFLGKIGALLPIPPNYWGQATFTYWFLYDDTEDKEHTNVKSVPGGPTPPQYTDLKVNKSQALEVWPEDRRRWGL